MQKSLQFTYSSINDISAIKSENAVAKTLLHRLKVVKSDNALVINSDYVNDSAMLQVAHLPWQRDRNSLPQVKKHNTLTTAEVTVTTASQLSVWATQQAIAA